MVPPCNPAAHEAKNFYVPLTQRLWKLGVQRIGRSGYMIMVHHGYVVPKCYSNWIGYHTGCWQPKVWLRLSWMLSLVKLLYENIQCCDMTEQAIACAARPHATFHAMYRMFRCWQCRVQREIDADLNTQLTCQKLEAALRHSNDVARDARAAEMRMKMRSDSWRTRFGIGCGPTRTNWCGIVKVNFKTVKFIGRLVGRKGMETSMHLARLNRLLEVTANSIHGPQLFTSLLTKVKTLVHLGVLDIPMPWCYRIYDIVVPPSWISPQAEVKRGRCVQENYFCFFCYGSEMFRVQG